MEKTLKSEFEELTPPTQKTIPEYYLAKAKKFAEEGSTYWLVDGITDEKLYFNKFEEETGRIASAFWKLGLRKGDAVIYMIRDLSKISFLLIGVLRANGVMRATYPDDDEDTILQRVNESKVRFIVCEEDSISTCEKVAARAGWNIDIITARRSTSSKHSLQEFLEDDDASSIPELQISEDDPAIILCTSGTTGLPKGAVHTHRNFLFLMRSHERIPFTLHKPNLLATKATHISGTITGLIYMACGKTCIVVSDLTKDNIFNAAAKYKVGSAFAFPTFLLAMTGPEGKAYDFSSIEIVLTGGSPITPAIREAIMQLPNVKDICMLYGLTEMNCCTTSAILKDDKEREIPTLRDLPNFSVGKPFPGVCLQIRDIITSQVLGPNERGEVCIKSQGLFHSYLLNLEATQDTFDKEYFKTGDIGYYDQDGYIYVVDRLKDIFKYYNNHISPTELENVIGKHPKVKEVCVVGVPDPGGHVPRAFVAVHPNSGDKLKLAEEIKEFANSNLATYKHLQGGVYIIDEIPRGKSGKVTRRIVADLELPQ